MTAPHPAVIPALAPVVIPAQAGIHGQHCH